MADKETEKATTVKLGIIPAGKIAGLVGAKVWDAHAKKLAAPRRKPPPLARQRSSRRLPRTSGSGCTARCRRKATLGGWATLQHGN
jgi:hypothetical protein